MIWNKIHEDTELLYVTTFLCVVLLSILILVLILKPVSVHSAEPQQLVFTFNHKTPDGRTVVVIKHVTVVMGWTPVKTSSALATGDYMICTPFVIPVAIRKLDGQDVGPREEIAFRCGENLYLMTNLNIRPEK